MIVDFVKTTRSKGACKYTVIKSLNIDIVPPVGTRITTNGRTYIVTAIEFSLITYQYTVIMQAV